MHVTGPVLQPGQLRTSRGEVGEDAYQALVEQREMRFDVEFSFSALWAVGVNMSFRRAPVIDLGGFDEFFQGAAFGEDARIFASGEKEGQNLLRTRRQPRPFAGPQRRMLRCGEPA